MAGYLPSPGRTYWWPSRDHSYSEDVRADKIFIQELWDSEKKLVTGRVMKVEGERVERVGRVIRMCWDSHSSGRGGGKEISYTLKLLGGDAAPSRVFSYSIFPTCRSGQSWWMGRMSGGRLGRRWTRLPCESQKIKKWRCLKFFGLLDTLLYYLVVVVKI